ncbi:MAG: nucleoside deaminase [Spirochaetota bacterium]|jgi:cytosine deaminase|nr:nucleoside deaminase [Spirochaetota bacterium]
MRISTIEEAVQSALQEARAAEAKGTYGVGGALIDLRSGRLLKTMESSVVVNGRLIDPTAHGERKLVDWYFAQENRADLVKPQDAAIITSLDPCCMCTGSILIGGFRAIIAAPDDKAGINYDGTNSFLPFDRPLQTFYYPGVRDGEFAREEYGVPPDIFQQTDLRAETHRACLDAFVSGAANARRVIREMNIPVEKLQDLAASAETPLRALYPYALGYRAPKRGCPDRKLLPYLEEAAHADAANGGDGDAAAFLDYFGNLLICMPGQKNRSPIRTAYMEMIRAYSRLRYDLAQENASALAWLHEPKHGTIVLYRGFDKGARGLVDLGAYGSTISGGRPVDRNLLCVHERIPGDALATFIANMPPRYRDLIRPQRMFA